MRFRVYQDGRFASGAVAAGRTLTVYGEEAMTTALTLYAAATGATEADNPYTVPATGIVDFWTTDSAPWGLAQGDTVARPLRVLDKSGVYSVSDYGATGDGSTDDAGAIQAAITAASTDGGEVYIPPGTYIIGTVLLHESYVTLRGAGMGVTTLKLKDATAANVINCGRSGYTGEVLHARIESLTIDGNSANQTSAAIYPIQAWGTVGLVIDRVEIKNATRHAIGLFESPITDTVITNCYLHDAERCLLYASDAHGLTMSGNRLEAWSLEGADVAPAIGFVGTANDRVIFADNQCVNGSGERFFMEASTIISDSSFTGNVIDANDLNGSGISGYFDRTVFSGNVVLNGSGHGSRSGYELVGNDLLIEGNRIEDGCISFSAGAGAKGKRISVVGNQIAQTSADGNAIAFGTSANPVSDVLISCNIIDMTGSSGSAEGIAVGTYGTSGEVDRVQIVGNIIYGPGSGVASTRGIRLLGAAGSSGLLIADNLITACYAGVSSLSNTNHDEVTVTGNDLRGNGAAFESIEAAGTWRVYGNILADDKIGMTLNSAGNTVQYAAAAPSAGTYLQGDIVWNTGAAAEGTVGWVCTSAGSPGTWKTFGVISA